MKLLPKIVLSILIVSAAFMGWWLRREKAIATQMSSERVSLRALAEHGDAGAEFTLGRMYAEGKGAPQNYALATAWYRKAAEQGYAKAQFNLGEIYFLGHGVAKDYSEALVWIQKAADQGDAKAEDAIGFIYYNGQGAHQDYAEAARWYRKAAEQGYPVAQQALAYMYFYGVGVPQDYTEALQWYRKTAEQGDAEAQEALGYMYATGRGVPRDRNEAITWYRQAAAKGNAKAKRALESLETGGLIGSRGWEILTAFIGFPVGLWLSLDFLVRGRTLRGRQAAMAVLGLIFLLNASLSLYALTHNVRYSPHQDTFDIARWLLNAAAVLIIATAVLPAKKKQGITS